MTSLADDVYTILQGSAAHYWDDSYVVKPGADNLSYSIQQPDKNIGFAFECFKGWRYLNGTRLRYVITMMLAVDGWPGDVDKVAFGGTVDTLGRIDLPLDLKTEAKTFVSSALVFRTAYTFTGTYDVHTGVIASPILEMQLYPKEFPHAFPKIVVLFAATIISSGQLPIRTGGGR